MSARAEVLTTFDEAEPRSLGSRGVSVAIIGPNDSHRRILGKALTGSEISTVREFVDYPPPLSKLPQIVTQDFDVVMIDVDSDQSYALALVETLVAIGGTRVVAYSIRNTPDLQASCLKAGAHDFLPIPADAAEELQQPAPTLVEAAAEPEARARKAKK